MVALEDINAVEVKYGALNKGLVNDVKGFEDIKLLAKKASILESELADKNRYIRDLEIDMKKLKKYMNEPFDKNRNLENKVKDLEKDLRKYKKEYGYVVNFLQDIDQVDDARKYINEKREMENKNFKKLDMEFER